MYSDDETDIPLSSTRALERADHGKSERKEKAVKKQELQKLRLDMLKQNVRHPDQKDDQSSEQDMTTKTLDEEAKKEVQDIDAKPDMGQMIRAREREEASKDQTPYERSNDREG